MKGARIVSFAAACACVCSWVNVMLEWVLLVEHIFIRSWAAFQVYRLETSTGVCTQASLHGNIESKSGKCCRPEKQLSRFDSLAPSPFMSLHPQQHYELRGHRARAVTNVDLSGWGGQVPINISERANKPECPPSSHCSLQIQFRLRKAKHSVVSISPFILPCIPLSIKQINCSPVPCFACFVLADCFNF